MAISRTKQFTVDISPGGIPAVVHCSQGDKGRVFNAEIYNDGYALPSTVTVRLRGKKPDKTVFDYSATYDDDTGFVTFSTTEQMTIIPGPVECELVFTQGADVIATANFTLMVEASPYDPEAASESVIQNAEQIVHDWLDTHGVTLTLDTNKIVRLTTRG